MVDRMPAQAVQGGQLRRQLGRRVPGSSANGGIEMRHSSGGDSVVLSQHSPQQHGATLPISALAPAAAGGRKQGLGGAQSEEEGLESGSQDGVSPRVLSGIPVGNQQS